MTKLPKPDLKKGDEVVRTGVGVYHYTSEGVDDRSFKSLLIDEGLIKSPESEITEK